MRKAGFGFTVCFIDAADRRMLGRISILYRSGFRRIQAQIGIIGLAAASQNNRLFIR